MRGRGEVTPAIVVRGLVKTFGQTRALDKLDLVVEAGEVHGFLGPNGAGKTTTIRVLLGLLRADAGEVALLGGNPWKDAVELHRRLAYVPGDVSLWPKLSGGEVIDVFGRLRGELDPRRRDELIERFELDPTKKARTYSKDALCISEVSAARRAAVSVLKYAGAPITNPPHSSVRRCPNRCISTIPWLAPPVNGANDSPV